MRRTLNYKERQYLIEILINRIENIEKLSSSQLQQQISKLIGEQYSRTRLALPDRKILVKQIFDAVRGFDILQVLLDNPSITEIMVNGPQRIYIEENGRLALTDLSFENRQHLVQVICRFFGRANKLINETSPIAGMRLADGSRIHAVLPPAAPDGPCLSIRRFTGIKPNLQSLIERQTISQTAADYLVNAVRNKQSIFVSGGTGTGKTTFLNALSAYIPPQERIITIEDSPELNLKLGNVVRLESRQAGPSGQGEVTLEDLIKSSLRLRPDRIIVGEIRGGEALEMIQAMSTGHPGSMSTGHGNSCQEMVDRICLLMLINSHLPWEAVRRLTATALDLIVHLERLADGRRVVKEITRLSDYRDQHFIYTKLFALKEGQLIPLKESNTT